MALSTHLVNSFEHQHALDAHRRSYPVPNQVKREPFTPQYIITRDSPAEPEYKPEVSELYNQSHGRPLMSTTRANPNPTLSTTSTARMDGHAHTQDRKPPITQRRPPPPSHAFAIPPPSPLSTWEHQAPADPDFTQGQPTYSHASATGQSQGQGQQEGQFVRMSEYTAGQIATLQSRLQKQLGPEYIMNRPGPGGGPALR